MPFPVSTKKFSPKDGEMTPTRAHVVAKKTSIFFRTSVLLNEAPSNPGVSMRATLLLLRVSSSAIRTSAAHDFEFVPIARFERLARLMNWGSQVSL